MTALTPSWIQPTVSVVRHPCASGRRHSSSAVCLLEPPAWRRSRWECLSAFGGVRQFWDDESPSPGQVYCWYWNETLGGAALDLAKTTEAAATASAVAKSIGVGEVVDYLRDPDKVAFYGMMNILPATPIRWGLENMEAADRHLHYG